MSDAIWVAIIASASAIIPQLLNQYFSYKKDVKLKTIDFYNQNKLNAVIDFLDTVGESFGGNGITGGEKANYQKALNKLLLYFPDIDSDSYIKVFKSLSEWDINKRYEVLMPIIKQLSKSIQDK